MFRKSISQSKSRSKYGHEVLGDGMKRQISEKGCEKGVFKGSIVDQGCVESVERGFEICGNFGLFCDMRRKRRRRGARKNVSTSTE